MSRLLLSYPSSYIKLPKMEYPIGSVLSEFLTNRQMSRIQFFQCIIEKLCLENCKKRTYVLAINNAALLHSLGTSVTGVQYAE